ncbi:glycosyltransferase family 2 protein [Flavobacterium sp. I-SCBP12n]|uniref:Glycosyltransferase family 2 protein n=1 Tax=Flavobacterium pygoscelis TaxID=2893176 RepID=A0A9X2BPY6_9FLAO|nr:glycosyltransferase family 2 protein [Flavobacterium pygoscelis]MCK8141926.1 glycosyltransferase family 2 protein [Flavobacterium pygoscelis]
MLAIIIPYYKITFFDETLKSLSNQTNRNFKVYIGDDFSPENPSELLKKYENKIDFIYQKFDNNFGRSSLTKQWERCIKLNKNEKWLMLLGDDDVLSENFVETFYNKRLFFEELYDVVRFSVIKIDSKTNPISNKIQNIEIESSKNILFNTMRSSLSEYVFKTSTVNKIGFKNFPLAWWSDVLAVLEFSNFNDIYSINNSYVKVRISELSISGSSNFEQQKEKSSYLFYNYLLLNKKKYFTYYEIDFLLERISKRYLNNRSNIKLFYKISATYFKNGKFIAYFKFLNRIIKSIFYKCE